jgi:protein TonB
MSTYTGIHEPPQDDRLSGGFAGAIALHVALLGLLIGAAYLHLSHDEHWGDKTLEAGAIQASMVSAIPLPPKAPPVKNAVLTPDEVSPAPTPPPKEATQPPPKDTDILLKAKSKPAKIAPVTTAAAPKHPQPVPDTRKASTGESATQLPQAISRVTNGTAALNIIDRSFGDRYAYYVQIIKQKIADNWYTQEADPRTSQGRSVVVAWDIERDGTPVNPHVVKSSGSSSLDASAIRAIQRIDTFGPLPAGNSLPIQDTFTYQANH